MTDSTPLIDVIAGAFHAANCADPERCPNDCSGRMTTKQAVAVRLAVGRTIDQRLDEIFGIKQ